MVDWILHIYNILRFFTEFFHRGLGDFDITGERQHGFSASFERDALPGTHPASNSPEHENTTMTEEQQTQMTTFAINFEDALTPTEENTLKNKPGNA